MFRPRPKSLEEINPTPVNYRQRRISIGLFALIVVLVIIGFIYWPANNTSSNVTIAPPSLTIQSSAVTPSPSSEASHSHPSSKATVSKSGNLPHEHVTSKANRTTVIEYRGQDSRTAVGILEDSHMVEWLDTATGPIIESIDDYKVDPEKECWAFYVNGKLATEPAYAYITNNSEKILWKVEAI